MTADDSLDIQFGELEEAKPEVRLRPDANKHFAVVAVYEPREGELPIYVDLDAMRDMEEHALSDTSVELGGVMLGGQYEDEERQKHAHDGCPRKTPPDSGRADYSRVGSRPVRRYHFPWMARSRCFLH